MSQSAPNRFGLSTRDEIENLFGKSDDDAAREREKSVRSLRGVVRF